MEGASKQSKAGRKEARKERLGKSFFCFLRFYVYNPGIEFFFASSTSCTSTSSFFTLPL